MTTAAKIGHGALFEIFSGAVWNTVAEVTSITPPGLSRDAVDATHSESPNKYREFVPGLKDAGEVSIELNWVPNSASDDLIRAAFESDAIGQYRITLPPVAGASPVSESVSFEAIVTGYEPEVPVDDKMTATVTLKVTGQASWS